MKRERTSLKEREQRTDRVRRCVVGGLLWLVLIGTVGFQPMVFKRHQSPNRTIVTFSPADISGMQLWLKADAIVGLNNNDPVTTWEDSSSANNDATQSTSAQKPTYKTSQIDGKAAVSGDGNDYMNLPNSFSGNTAGEVFCVIKLDADPGAANDGIIWRIGNNGAVDHYPLNDGDVYLGWGADGRPNTGNPTQSLAVWHLLNVAIQANDFKVRINNVQHYSDNTLNANFITAPTVIGEAFEPAGMKGMIAEMIFYNSVLSAGNRTSMTNYFKGKYPSLGL